MKRALRLESNGFKKAYISREKTYKPVNDRETQFDIVIFVRLP